MPGCLFPPTHSLPQCGSISGLITRTTAVVGLGSPLLTPAVNQALEIGLTSPAVQAGDYNSPLCP